MTPQQAKERFGATHYAVMANGVTPQMFYKQQTEKFNNGTFATRWVYLSFANIWMGSAINDKPDEIANLKEIL